MLLLVLLIVFIVLLAGGAWRLSDHRSVLMFALGLLVGLFIAGWPARWYYP